MSSKNNSQLACSGGTTKPVRVHSPGDDGERHGGARAEREKAAEPNSSHFPDQRRLRDAHENEDDRDEEQHQQIVGERQTKNAHSDIKVPGSADIREAEHEIEERSQDKRVERFGPRRYRAHPKGVRDPEGKSGQKPDPARDELWRHRKKHLHQQIDEQTGPRREGRGGPVRATRQLSPGQEQERLRRQHE